MSTERKHTPGPWHVDESYSESGVLTSLGIHSSHGAVPATFENAYLMAAAPEMLQALKDCRDLIENMPVEELLMQVEAAIAKAEGRAEA